MSGRLTGPKSRSPTSLCLQTLLLHSQANVYLIEFDSFGHCLLSQMSPVYNSYVATLFSIILIFKKRKREPQSGHQFIYLNEAYRATNMAINLSGSLYEGVTTYIAATTTPTIFPFSTTHTLMPAVPN